MLSPRSLALAMTQGVLASGLVVGICLPRPACSSEDPVSLSQHLSERIAEAQQSFVLIVAEAPVLAHPERRLPGSVHVKARRLVGCGVVLDAEGHVLTTSSVVQNARSVTAIPVTGQPVRGDVIGADPLWDLAVVRVPRGSMPEALVGNSDSLRTGSWVMLLGADFGTGPLASLGLITGRAQSPVSWGGDVLTVYAPIRPGDSGAVLLNGSGEVVGIVAATVEGPSEMWVTRESQFPSVPRRTRALRGYVEGIAIPINQALAAAWDVIERGPIPRGFLGVTIRNVAGRMTEMLDLEPGEGAYVVGVVEGGPASVGGIRPGDVIFEMDGAAVLDPRVLHRRVVESLPGTVRQVAFFRAGKRRVASVRIGDYASQLYDRSPDPSPNPEWTALDLTEIRRRALTAEVRLLKARLAELESRVQSLDR